jgi:hypothetical protein
MQGTFSIISILYLIGAAQGAFLALALFSYRQDQSGLVITSTVWCFHRLFHLVNRRTHQPELHMGCHAGR